MKLLRIFKNRLFYILSLSLIFLVSCDSINDSINDSDVNLYSWVNSIHTNLGLPYDNDTTNDFIIVRSQYVVNYNKELNVPNLVCWELNKNWFGDVPRYSGNFITDTSLPYPLYRVKHSDYTNSGYDRGHLCMSENRTATAEDNKATFILTNIFPQTPDLNRGVWFKFEDYCNELCLKENKELFIIAGGIYKTKSKIQNIVTIPDSCFKIVVVLNKGENFQNINENTTVISVVMPNIEGVRNDDWSLYLTSVRNIEKSTGFNFFSKISKSLQNKIETKIIKF